MTVSARDIVGIPLRILPSLIEKKTPLCRYTLTNSRFLSYCPIPVGLHYETSIKPILKPSDALNIEHVPIT